MFKSIALTTGVALAALSFGTSANALSVDPATGLTDFVFYFDGPGSSATFSGDDTLDIVLTGGSELRFHVEDCCTVGDEWDLVFGGSTIAWDMVQSGDGVENGDTDFGAVGDYFEAIAVLTLGAGSYSFDLTQTVGIPGGSWVNIDVAAVPVPAALPLLALGLGALGATRRRRNKA